MVIDREKTGEANAVVRLFLERPVSVFMAFFALLVVGVIAYRRIPLELVPTGFQPRSLTIVIFLPDSTPTEVEQKITRPLERIMGTVAGLKSIRTNSHADGCQARLQFEENISVDDAYLQVRDRLDRIQAEFPEGTRRPQIWKFNINNFPVAFLAVSLRKGAPAEQLRNESLIVKRIQNRLKRIPGLARVNYMGGFATSIDIDMRPEQVEGMGIDLYQLVQRMQADNFTLSAGRVREADQVHFLRSVARFDSVGSLLRYPVRPGLQLGELAQIQARYALDNQVVRVNGLRSVAMELSKKSDANTVDVCLALRRVIEEELETDPQLRDFRFQVIWDQGTVIVEAIDNLKKTILEGALVALLVLLLFLRSFRMTLVVMVAIPVSLLAALVAMFFLGETLNLISLMGLTLGVGMLVDNSVVVVESIRTRTEAGEPPRRAALIGTSRVMLAILIATSTTVVVFLPLMLTGESGLFRFIIMRLGLPVCLSLLASLLVAMLLIPPSCRMALRAGQGQAPRWVPGLILAVGRSVSRFLGSVQQLISRVYVWLLRVSLGRRLELLALAILLAGSTFWARDQLEQTDMERGEDRQVTVRLRLPDQWTLQQISDAVGKAEDALLRNKSQLDLKWLFTHFDGRRALLLCFLKEQGRTITRKDAEQRIKKLLPEMAGVIVKIGREGGGNQDEQAELPIVLHGRDTRVLSSLSEEVVELLSDLPGLKSVHGPLEEGQPEVLVRIDRELAERYGVRPNVAAGMIAYSYRGQFLPKLRAGDREFYLRLQMDRADDPRLDEVKALLIPSDSGTRVPLATIARFERKQAFDSIHREDRRTVLRIRAKTDAKDLPKLAALIDARLRMLRFPEGYGFKKEGRFEEIARQTEEFKKMAWLAVALVFLLMGFLFESWLLPLAILASIPFAFFGVYWVLYLTNTPMEVMSFIGLIVLIGIVINNGVVLIDRVHTLRSETDRFTAIVQGAQERFRPVLMTALTTIGGLLPMALGDSEVTGIPYYHLGRTVIGGLAASTFMTLLLVPVMYTLFDDLSQVGRGLLARRSLREAPAS